MSSEQFFALFLQYLSNSNCFLQRLKNHRVTYYKDLGENMKKRKMKMQNLDLLTSCQMKIILDLTET